VWQQVVDHKLLRIAHNAAYFCLVAPRPLQLFLSQRNSIRLAKNHLRLHPENMKNTVFNYIID
jgi:hypothetical protein